MSPDLPNSTRVARLKKRFLDVLSGSTRLDARTSSLFLEGLCAQEDPVVCLNAVSQSAHGLSSFQSAMRVDLSVQFMNGLGFTVLEYLLRTLDVGGDALDNVLFHLVEPPIFWDAFVCAFQRGELGEDSQLVFVKLLSRLLTLRNHDTTPYRAFAAQPQILDGLIASSRHEIREIGYLIKHILSDATVVSCILDGPGGRHDNDFADYREIAIFPTADEVSCRMSPFLRSTFHDEFDTSTGSFSDYLDNTFRMFREDMLFDIREGLRIALKRRKKKFCAVSMVGVYTGMDNRKVRWGIELQCGTESGPHGDTEGGDTGANLFRWNADGSKIPKDKSFVGLISGQDIISFGTVIHEDELLACNPPVIVLRIDDVVNTRKALTSLCTTMDLRLIELSTPTFAFEPVLTGLQKIHSVPLIEDILFRDQDAPVSVPRNRKILSSITNVVAENFSVDLSGLVDLPTSVCLDASQARSLIAGLSERVSLIQGPPGTGKSFIGTILAKVIHDRTSQTILVVCYTNHALDQFLGDLLKFGVPARSIVRLGSRPHQSTEHLSLNRQPYAPSFHRDWDKINALKRDALSHEGKLEYHFEKLLDTDDEYLMTHLKMTDHDSFEAFHVPLETEDGMMVVGEYGRPIDENYLFSRWARGLDAGVLSGEPHVRASSRLWGMDHSARQQLLATWQEEFIARAIDSICQVGDQWNALQDDVAHEFGRSKVAVLHQTRIIGCTTTGAAIYAQAIKQVGPEVLLVEEAGEILESHILTALSPKVDQMILIGDHKQLRPKVNNYRLTVESGAGYDLNRSLFERLVLKGYPHETLSTQHRMRPEISTFVRELTYPDLTDAPSTRQRPDIRGVASNVVFVNHTHPEAEDSVISDTADGGADSSKKNTYEVQMVLKMVRHFAQQGYNSEDIVVLTPYLGQLRHLRDALQCDNDPILTDLDSLELARAGLSVSTKTEGKSKKKKGQIRLATIDNYQGEESRIVIASLTRSNRSNAIGFMNSPERLNVLLSRARDGLIIIGNSHTFLNSKKGGALWKQFFALLEKGEYIYQGFPVKCERHPERVSLLLNASDFDAHCPDGGCTNICGFTLACGHECRMKCHPHRSKSVLRDPHDASLCDHDVHAMCSAGHHKIVWVCHLGRPSVCSVCVEENERLEAVALKMLEQEQKHEEAKTEHHHRMAELETELCAVQATQTGRGREDEESGREEKYTLDEHQKDRGDTKVQEQATGGHEEDIPEGVKAKEDKKEERKRRKEERKMRRIEEKGRKKEEKKMRRIENKRKREEENGSLKAEVLRYDEEQTKFMLAVRPQEEEEEREKEDQRKQEQAGRLFDAAHMREETDRLAEIARKTLEQEQKHEKAKTGHDHRMAGLEAELHAVRATQTGQDRQDEESGREEKYTLDEHQKDGGDARALEQATGGCVEDTPKAKKDKKEEKRRKKEEIKKEKKVEKRRRREERKMRRIEDKGKQEEDSGLLRPEVPKYDEERTEFMLAVRPQEEEEERKKEDQTKREEQAERLLNAARRRKEERKKEDQTKREEQAGRLLDAAHRRKEERKKEDQRKREEQAGRLLDAAHRRKEERKKEDQRKREEQAGRLLDAAHRRKEKHKKEETSKRKERTERLLEAAHTMQEERKREAETRQREENAKRLHEATQRRREEMEERVREDRQVQVQRLVEGANQRCEEEVRIRVLEEAIRMGQREEQAERIQEATRRLRVATRTGECWEVLGGEKY